MSSLYVFVQSDIKATALERVLKRRLSGMTVTAFGKYRDLKSALSSKPPDAFLAVEPVLVEHRIAAVIEGVRDDKPWEPYVLLSVEQLAPGSLAGKTIGVVDILGRAEMQRLVDTVLGIKGLKVKRVSKQEDLLPLLLFSAADAVLTGASAVQPIQQRSRLPLKAQEIAGSRLGFPVVGILNQQVRQSVTRTMLSMDSELSRILGVERWRVR